MKPKKNTKTIEKVEQENKKPPITKVVQKETEAKKPTTVKKDTAKKEPTQKPTTVKKEENKKEPTRKDTKKETKKEKVKVAEEITENTERDMLKGQEHIEESKTEAVEIPNEEIKEEEKKDEVVVKPRETYLQEKISKMNINKDLFNNIQKNLDVNIKNIIEENIKIPEKINDLQKYLEKEKDSVKNAEENYSNKIKHKEVKNLMEELKILNNNLIILQDNEQLLKNEDFSKLSTSNNVFDKSIQENQLKSIKEQKEKISETMKYINSKINDILGEHKSVPNKEKVKIFLDNFKRDKEIIEIRTKKYMKESKQREKTLQNEIKKLFEKRQKEIEAQDKEAKLKKEENLRKFKEKEKEIEKKRSKLSEELFIKCKPYIFKKPEKTKNSYLYHKKYEEYLMKSEKHIKDETNKNKIQKNLVNLKDIEKFAMEYDEKLEKRKQEQDKKSMDLVNSWQKNKDSLPKSNYKEAQNEENKEKEEEEEKLAEKAENRFRKYGQNVRENFLPEIDTKKKAELEKLIFDLENPIQKIKEIREKRKKERAERSASKPKEKNKRYDNKSKNDMVKNEIISKNLIKKPKKINFAQNLKTSSDIQGKKLDYLKEIREQNIRPQSSKNRKTINDEDDEINKMNKKWEKVINNHRGNLIQNMKDIELKVGLLQQKADSNEQLLKFNGGLENNPELGKKVSNLLIDSITAKMSLIKKMYV